ncbi:putative ATPase [Sporomusaceae bacterium BoRhaA]|uniref:AAA family ATPase n=1 Tax=Pelorhabdus rhamnosifermentans TaxID=2772457 RepID=UPI001C0616C7|nr:AAA family ATPase [Pelorhabdus rhamnosifermentans]MBU2700195.1 putative ATPase [Pelorhabdus rhamnosifermentans]
MEVLNTGHYLRSVKLLRDKIDYFNQYPFSLPAFRDLHCLEFHPQVTFIVGENGTGKSTLLEAIAIAWGFNPEGGTCNFNFSSRNSHSELHEYIRLIRGARKPRDGFFLRAESFYNLATQIDELKVSDFYGGRSLHEQSHGEAFFSTFMNKFKGNGLYILDEPEAALSPMRQMAMISIIHDLANKHSQFIIATHSPIIMGYPNAIILQISNKGFDVVEYEKTEHYVVMTEFINNRKKMLDVLLDEKKY